MNYTFTPEALEELINQVQMATSQVPSLIFTPNVWIQELERNPQRFYRNDKGELLYRGYMVETVMTLSGLEEKFWSMADKIVKREN
jgi:hypothetical protein